MTTAKRVPGHVRSPVAEGSCPTSRSSIGPRNLRSDVERIRAAADGGDVRWRALLERTVAGGLHRPIPMIRLHHILCPVDLSDTSTRALQHAAALAGWYESALQVLYVDTTLPIEGLSNVGDFAVARHAVIEAAPTERARDEVRRFVARAGCNTTVDVAIEQSTHVEGAILERACVLPADLIVMGSHGRSGVQRLLLGSVTEHVLRGAACPVLVVPPTTREGLSDNALNAAVGGGVTVNVASRPPSNA